MKGALIASSTKKIYQSSPVGRLPLTKVNGYDPAARMISMSRPWSEGGYRKVSYYTGEEQYSAEYALVREEIINPQNYSTPLKREQYSYSLANNIKRIEIQSTASGSTHSQLIVKETWLGDTRRRARMSQAINGVQTWHEYEASSLHGSLYSHSTEIRVEGSPVAGQSIRTVTYINSQGNTTREEQYALLTNGTWELSHGMPSSYEVQNHRIVRTQQQPRTMCNGSPLWEIDENGICAD